MRRKPTKEELLAAVGSNMPDLIGPRLKVLFSGINPSVYSAVVGYHFARPGNRFWPTLYASGITDRLLAPHEMSSMSCWPSAMASPTWSTAPRSRRTC